MDNKKIEEALTSMLSEVADQARQDARDGVSNIGSIYKRERSELKSLDPAVVDEAIKNIKRATATKKGTKQLLSAVMLAARVIATKSV